MGLKWIGLLVALTLAAALAVGWPAAFAGGAASPSDYREVDRLPRIRPDYAGTVIPASICPLNFTVQEPGAGYFVRLSGDRGEAIEIRSSSPAVDIPLRPWRDLLHANRGKELFVDVFVEDAEGGWTRYGRISNRVAEEPIDGHLVYRKLNPNYNFWADIGIYQRDLSGWEESVVLHGRSMGTGCVNCHTFNNGDPDRMFIGIRGGSFDSGTLLADGGKVDKIGTSWGYMTWHPSGLMTVQAMIKVRQFFHRSGDEVRDVIDLDAALVAYDLRTRSLKTAPGLSDDDRLETYPTWAPDGRHLYFCSAPILWQDRDRMVPEAWDEVRYDLRRIPYDIESDEWGEPETVLSAEETGGSLLLPRVSPDGRFLLYCMTDYGCFPIFQPGSDLHMLDLRTGEHRRLDINSEQSESWHSWSTNGAWIAFSSKRRDGLFTRIYVSHVDERGRAHKPFILPQRDPLFYDSHMKAYSVPEFTTGPVKIGQAALAAAGRGPATIELVSPVTFDSTPTRGARLTGGPVGHASGGQP